MVNPNSGSINLRRHCSLPTSLPPCSTTFMVQSATTFKTSLTSTTTTGIKNGDYYFLSSSHPVQHFLMENKSNPHVGWFRHAPPACHVAVGGGTSATMPLIMKGRVCAVPSFSHQQHQQQQQQAHCSTTIEGARTWLLRVRGRRISRVEVTHKHHHHHHYWEQQNIRFKNSPFVGWFRHAPSFPNYPPHRNTNTNTSSSSPCFSTKPTSFVDQMTLFEQEVMLLLQHIPADSFSGSSMKNHGGDIRELRELVSGHLKGGAPGGDNRAMVHYSTHSASQRRQFLTQRLLLQQQSSSATVKLLDRLAWWMLLPFNDENDFLLEHDAHAGNQNPTTNSTSTTKQPKTPSSVPSSFIEDDESDEDDDSETSSLDGPPPPSNQDPPEESLSSSQSFPYWNLSVSSQAEAYYAHTLAKEFDLAASSVTMRVLHDPLGENGDANDNRNDDPHGLDYNITQMDIVRMNRNASRHLNVDSIVKLPIMTYQKAPVMNTRTTIPADPSSKNCAAGKDNNSNDNKAAAAATTTVPSATRSNKCPEEWSWMMIQSNGLDADDDSDDQQHSSVNNGSDQDDVGSSSNNNRGTVILASEDDDDNNNSNNNNNNNTEDDSDQDVCVICLEHFENGDRLRVLPCQHCFHVGCIDRWLSGSHSFKECYTSGCPTCKKRPDNLAQHHHHPDHHPDQHDNVIMPSSSSPLSFHGDSSSVPSWAFVNVGFALSRDSRHFEST